MKIELKTGVYFINTEDMSILKELEDGFTSLLKSDEIKELKEFFKNRRNLNEIITPTNFIHNSNLKRTRF